MRPTPWSSATSRPTTRASRQQPETRDQRTYYAEYRATVEAAYSWDAAAQELRQVWEAHETKWPPQKTMPTVMATAT